MKKEVIPFNKLGELQQKQPGVFPIFGRIRMVNGVPAGEIVGYSDEYGRRIHMEHAEEKMYQ